MPPTLVPLIALCVVTLLVGIAIGYVGNDRASVWRRRFDDERRHYADYRARSEARHARQRAQLATTATDPPAPPVVPPMPVERGLGTTREVTRIVGIDDALADRLEALGVTTIHDLATLTLEDELALELRLGLNAGTITRDQWRSQAQLLDSGPAAIAREGLG